MSDYYEILGITKDATARQIKKAYRKLSKECHPDVGGDCERFEKIQNAYGILSDPERRKRYDEFGPEENLSVIISIAQSIWAEAASHSGEVDEEMEKACHYRIEEIKSEIAIKKNRLEKANKFLGAILNAPSPDSIGDILREEIRGTELAMAELKKRIKQNRLALDLLGKYTFKKKYKKYPENDEKSKKALFLKPFGGILNT